jgi:glucokinase
MNLSIGVDIGGTKVAAGAVDEDGRIVARVLRTTPSHESAAVADAIVWSVQALTAEVVAEGWTVSAVGIGAAGFIDVSRSRVLFAANVVWRDEPLRDVLSARLNMPVVVENDANAAAWAEARFGAGRGVDDLVVVTVGTGIGGGIVLGGRLYRGGFGIAAEMGHMRVVPDGHRCGCGNRGCWEQYASGRALVREAREIAVASPEQAEQLLALGGGTPEGITGPMVTKAACSGDPAAMECFRVVGAWLGQGLADLAAVLDPSVCVVGGGVSEAGDLLVDPARAAFANALTGRGHRPQAEIVLAQLGNDAGIVGAADLARR